MNKDHFEPEECLVGINKTSAMTNGDRIRAMTDEELVKGIIAFAIHCPQGVRPAPALCANGCFECWKNWLKQPWEVDHDTD